MTTAACRTSRNRLLHCIEHTLIELQQLVDPDQDVEILTADHFGLRELRARTEPIRRELCYDFDGLVSRGARTAASIVARDLGLMEALVCRWASPDSKTWDVEFRHEVSGPDWEWSARAEYRLLRRDWCPTVAYTADVDGLKTCTVTVPRRLTEPERTLSLSPYTAPAIAIVKALVDTPYSPPRGGVRLDTVHRLVTMRGVGVPIWGVYELHVTPRGEVEVQDPVTGYGIAVSSRGGKIYRRRQDGLRRHELDVAADFELGLRATLEPGETLSKVVADRTRAGGAA